MEWNYKDHDPVLKLLVCVLSCENNAFPTLSWGKKYINAAVVDWDLVEQSASGERILLPDDNCLVQGEMWEEKNHCRQSEPSALTPNLYSPANGDGLTCWPAGYTISTLEAHHMSSSEKNRLLQDAPDASLPVP